MDTKKLLGLKIKQLRKNRKLTQEKLAEIMNVDSGYVCKMELGMHTPSLAMLERLAKALSTELNEFLIFDDLKQIDYSEKLHILIDSISKDKQKQLYKIARALDI